MKIRVGFELVYEFAQKTPVVLMLNVHPSRATDLIEPDHLRAAPALPLTRYRDAFGNICTRLVAPQGELKSSPMPSLPIPVAPIRSSRRHASTR